MKRWSVVLMIPLNLVLLVWVWIGRIVFGVGGWFFLILLPVVLVLGIGLLVTTILALTQQGRPRSLTGLQSGAQLATWVGMLGFGVFLPDFGDTEESYLSFLTQVFGRSDALLDVSWVLTFGFAAVAVIGYGVLLGSLVLARRQAPVTTLAAA